LSSKLASADETHYMILITSNQSFELCRLLPHIILNYYSADMTVLFSV